MKVLILGVSGMLGHRLWHEFDPVFDTYGTARSELDAFSVFGLNTKKLVTNIDALNFSSIVAVVNEIRPDVVINCIGIIKQIANSIDTATMIQINSLLPHKLADLCKAKGSRLIHISTDCVFSGRKGSYLEDDSPDPVDLYGRTKQLGEVLDSEALTIRTSIIGRELGSSLSLVDWFLTQTGTVKGYRNANYSGLTTKALSDVIASIVKHHSEIQGLYHISAETIDKFELITLIRDKFRLKTVIEPQDYPVIDRSLNCERFQKAIAYQPHSWVQMIEEMAAEAGMYEKLRKQKSNG